MSTAPVLDSRIENRVTGDVLTFLETSEESGGERTLLLLELVPGARSTPDSYGTYAERVRVLRGRLIVGVGAGERELLPGDEAIAPPGYRRAFRNDGPLPALVEVELRPGHTGFEHALRIAYGLAADGRTDGKGTPRNPFHRALLLELAEVRERVSAFLAWVAHRRGVDLELERRYL